MATLKLPNRNAGIAGELPHRMEDVRQVHHVDFIIWAGSVAITIAILGFCWLLCSNMLYRDTYNQPPTNSATLNKTAATMTAPASATLENFSHGDMPLLPVFNAKTARPLQ